MSAPAGLERCLTFINSQLLPGGQPRGGFNMDGHRRAVTLSRQAGCGAREVAEKLAEYLQAGAGRNQPQWMIFDRNLVQKVLEDHALPERLAKFMPEAWSSEIRDTIDDLCGLHPPSWLLVRQTAETILRLATLGNVILIGRGANIITARLEHVVHVRLVAPLETRVRRIQQCEHLDQKAALEFINQQDRGRRRYLRKHYQSDIDSPLLYHLMINTDMVGCEPAARLIGDYVLSGKAKERLAGSV